LKNASKLSTPPQRKRNRITLLRHNSQCMIGFSRKIEQNVCDYVEWKKDFLKIIRPLQWKVHNQNLCMVCSWFNNTKYEEVYGWKSVKVYHIRQKGFSPCYNSFLPYISIHIKSNESKVVKYFKRIIFYTTTILNSITIIHKCVFTW
jgi:hypothetical protein